MMFSKEAMIKKYDNVCGKINGTTTLILLIPASHNCAGSP